MFCSSCGTKNDSKSRFCKKCGANLVKDNNDSEAKEISTERKLNNKNILIITLLIIGAIGFAFIKNSPTTPDVSMANWQVSKDATEKISVDFPCKPERDRENLKITETISADYTQDICTLTDLEAFAVSTTFYPSSVDLSINPREAIKGAIEGSKNNVQNGSVVSSSESTFYGHPSSDAIISATENGVKVEIKAKYIVIGNNLYSIFATYRPNYASSAIDRFISSIKLN